MQLIRLGDPSLSPFKCPSEKSSSPIPALTTAMQLKALHDGKNFVDSAPPGSRDVEYPSSPPSSINETDAQGTQSQKAHLSKDNTRESLTSQAEREALLKDETDVEDELELDIPRPQNLPELVPASGEQDQMADDIPRKINGRSVGIRCTRCKKSKKGCDRQRPCGRCADANEDCVTEDESTGRRGRGSKGRGKKW